jgi:hypothetical protein
VSGFTGRGVGVVNIRLRGLQMEAQRLDAVPGPSHLCQQVRCSQAFCALRKKQTGFLLSLAWHYTPHIRKSAFLQTPSSAREEAASQLFLPVLLGDVLS